MTQAAPLINTRLASALFVTLLLCTAAITQAKPEQLAQQSSDAWLAIVDSGKYADSWDEAAQLFKAAIAKRNGKTPYIPCAIPWAKLYPEKLNRRTTAKLCREFPTVNMLLSSTRPALSTSHLPQRRSLPCGTRTGGGESPATSSSDCAGYFARTRFHWTAFD